MGRAYKPNEIKNKKYKLLEWGPEWEAAFHQPEATGIWWIGGHSTNGKTAFIMALIKELASLGIGKILINSLEEGTRKVMQNNINRFGLDQFNSQLLITDENYTELDKRLKKQRAPWGVINDSIQGMRMSPRQFTQYREDFQQKHLSIFISHMDGNEPKGMTAKDVKYWADLKINVQGFEAISEGRYNEGGRFTAYDQGSARIWGTKTGKENQITE